jgi:hypothetical protein
MTTITLKEIKADQERLAEKIAAFEAKSHENHVLIPEKRIVLQEGDRYAGLIIGEEDEVSYHLILLPEEADDLNWKDAKKWAEKIGGVLPTHREQALLYANLKEEFQSAWYWSGEQYSDERYAWCQDFSDGGQSLSRTYGCLRARAVYRAPL